MTSQHQGQPAGSGAPPPTASDLAGSLLGLFADRSPSLDGMTVTIPPDWTSWQGRHGGLIAGMAVEVAAALHPDTAVKVVTARFARQVGDSPFAFRVSTGRAGRIVRTVEVTASQSDVEVMAATVTLAAGTADEAAAWFSTPPPPSLPPDRCPGFEFDRRFLPVGGHLDIRPCGGCFPLTAAAQPWMLAWVSIIPEVAIGPGAAVLMCDLAPGVYPLLSAPVAAPTVEMTVHLCADLSAAPGTAPALASQRNSATSGSWSVDDTSIWDASGRLVAQARQLRRIIGGLAAG